MAVCFAADDVTTIKNRAVPFKAVVAFYPYCNPIDKLNASLLVLIGKKDNWYPAERCEKLLASERARHEITLKVYENADHCFDWEGVNMIYLGHRLKYNHEAAEDAISQIQHFLSKHLK